MLPKRPTPSSPLNINSPALSFKLPIPLPKLPKRPTPSEPLVTNSLMLPNIFPVFPPVYAFPGVNAVTKSPIPPSPFAILTTAFPLLYIIAGPCHGPGITAATGAIFLTTFLSPFAIFLRNPNSGLPVIGLIDMPSPTVYSAGSKPMFIISCSNLCLVSGVITGGTTISPCATCAK